MDAWVVSGILRHQVYGAPRRRIFSRRDHMGDCRRMQEKSRYIKWIDIHQPRLLGFDTGRGARIRFQIIFGLFILVAGLVGMAGCQKHLAPLPSSSDSEKPLGAKQVPGIAEDEEPSGYVRLSHAQKDAMLSSLSLQRQKMGSWTDLRSSLERSLVYLQSKPADQPAVQSDDLTCSWGDLKATVEELIALLPELDAHPDRLRDNFDWYMLNPSTLMTGYYEPLIHASPAPCPEYPFPLYGRPPDLQVADLGEFHPRWAGQNLIYSIENGKIRPYPSRKEIDSDGVLEEQGIEIAWVRDLVDVFFLQIQGSGRLIFPDGTVRHVLYNGKNGRRYVSLGKVLINKGYMSADQMSMQGIRAFLKNRPEMVKDLLNTNPSYVFFRLGHDGPYGAMGAPLTPLVSMASDPARVPLGSVLLNSVTLPGAVKGLPPIVLLGLAQDHGGAIKGDHLDLFCGAGETAAFLAGHMQEQARACILIRTKNDAGTQ